MSKTTVSNKSQVLVEQDGGVATVFLNKPDSLNSLDEALRLLLYETFLALNQDPAVRVVVVTGKGRGFCVGQDLSQVAELDDAHDTVARTYNPLITMIVEAEKPYIAAVNGLTVGAGMGLALACDLVVMAEPAVMICGFGKMALVPDSGVTTYLTQRVGHRRAFEIAVTGRKISSEEAAQYGLATHVVPEADLLTTTRELAGKLVAEPPKILALTKRQIRQSAETTLAITMQQEALAQGIAAMTAEHVERRTAFLNPERKKD